MWERETAVMIVRDSVGRVLSAIGLPAVARRYRTVGPSTGGLADPYGMMAGDDPHNFAD